jgi:hypothetical protein
MLGKTLAITWVILNALVVLVGASSASAGAIVCKLGGGTQGWCPSGYESYIAPFTGLGLGKDTLSTSFVTIKCQGEIKGEFTSQGSFSNNARGQIKSVKWTNCLNNIGCANVTAVPGNLPWAVEVLSGSWHISNVLGSFSMECAFLGNVTCIYAASTVLPVFENHSAAMFHAMITANKLALSREAGSSGSCSSAGTWSALYDLDPEKLSVFTLV